MSEAVMSANAVGAAFDNASKQPFAQRFRALRERVATSGFVTKTSHFFKTTGASVSEVAGYIKQHYNEKHFDQHVDKTARKGAKIFDKFMAKCSRKYSFGDSAAMPLVEAMQQKSEQFSTFRDVVTPEAEQSLRKENEALRQRIEELESKSAEITSEAAIEQPANKTFSVSEITSALVALTDKLPDYDIEFDTKSGVIKLGRHQAEQKDADAPVQTVSQTEVSSANQGYTFCAAVATEADGKTNVTNYYLNKDNQCFFAKVNEQDSDDMTYTRCSAEDILTNVESARTCKDGSKKLVHTYDDDTILKRLMVIDKSDKEKMAARTAEVEDFDISAEEDELSR